MRPLALLWTLAVLWGLASPADARPIVIYPRDGTAVTTANINVYGAATQRAEVVKLRANEQTLIPFIRPNRTFEQSVRLRPGLNELQVGEHVIRVDFITPKQPILEGFVLRPLHMAMLKDCGGCHAFESPGDFSVRKPGSGLCIGCHADPSIGKDKAALPVGHSPVTEDRDCLACHDPHGGQGTGGLRKAVPGLCLDCHDPWSSGKQHVHGPVADGDCLACHAPHASAVKSLLVAPGDSLCLDCHDDPLTGLSVAHEAMDDGCGSCHDPHASSYRGILKKPQTEVCGACHDVPKPSKGVVVHSPIADDRECTACHAPHGGKAARFLVKAVPALCADCHDDVVALGRAGGSVHPPAEEGSCGDCHKPHSGPPGLLVNSSTMLCLDCHDAFAAPKGGSLHAPAGDGDCGDCHAPHASAGKSLLKGAGAVLCLECHERFGGKTVHGPVEDGACSDCHLPHVSKNRSLLVKDGMGLCLDCHDDPTTAAMLGLKGSVHGPIREDKACSPCHAAHAGEEHLLRASKGALCGICHGSMTQRRQGGEFAFIHPPVREGDCLDCHAAHASKEPRLLTKGGGKALCLDCHTDPGLNPSGKPWKSLHPPVLNDCQKCHVLHGSDEKGLLRSAQNSMCAQCHPDHSKHSLDAGHVLSGKATMVKVPPEYSVEPDTKQMVCSGCHLAHGSDYERMFKMPKDWLCRKCHNF